MTCEFKIFQIYRPGMKKFNIFYFVRYSHAQFKLRAYYYNRMICQYYPIHRIK